MKAKTKAKAKSVRSAKGKPGAKAAKRSAKPARAKPAAKARRAAAKGRVAKSRTKKPLPRARAKGARKPAARGSRWINFVAKHGVVLASARGPVPSVAEAVAGEPIVGSWWAHPKGNQIFAALSELDDSNDVRCFKLVDGKVTLVHRKAWPALVRLGRDGVIASEQLGALKQEHMPSGEHRNFITPFPEWVDELTDEAALQLTTEQARAQLAWVEG